MQPRSSKDMSKPSAAMRPPPLRNVLPFEILSMIFDSVSQPLSVQVYNPTKADYTESEVAYKKCFLPLALVCRHWHVAASPYLNRILSIRFIPGLTAETGAGPKGLLEVLHWLDTQLSLPGSVRRLRLIMADAPVESSDEPVLSESDQLNALLGVNLGANKPVEISDEQVLGGCDPSLVHTLLRRFPNVQAVELFNLIFDHKQVVAHASTITTAHTDNFTPIDLDTLVLAYSAQRPLSANVVQLCTAWFGSVSRFTVRSDSKRALIPGATLETLPARLATRTLTIDIPVHKDVMERLRRSPTFGDQGTLRTLHVKIGMTIVDSLDSLNLVVRPAANVLKELHLDFTPWVKPNLTPYEVIKYSTVFVSGSERFSWPIVDLGALPRLRELTVQLALNQEWLIVGPIMDTLLPRPQTDENRRRLPPLRCVTLALYDGWGVRSYGQEFTRASAVLAGVPTLEKCTLDLRAMTDVFSQSEQREAWLREYMAELHGKGVLHFVV